MTTIVASPPTFTSLPRLGWDGPSNNQGGFPAMSDEDVSRMFMPQRKVVTRSSSSSSLASNSSTGSTSTATSTNDSLPVINGDGPAPAKRKQRGGFWPVSKSESTSNITNAKANGAVQPTGTNGVNAASQKGALQPAVPEQAGHAVNGAQSRPQNPAILVLLPINGTFERKQINVPMHPDPPQKIGRQTNNKTTPKADNGYFDSKVLSRQHAEIWADATGRVWIRDVKSSNGTFVNGTRLSPENRESDPTELRQHDSLELGIDIVSEDQKTIVHHKVSAKVEFAGFPGKTGNALDLLSFGELDPLQNHSMPNSPMSAPMAHSRSQQGRPLTNRSSVASSVVGGNVNSVAQRQANYWGTPLNIEQLVKQVGLEMRAARQQAQDLEQANTFLTAILPADGSPARLPQGSMKDNNQQTKQANGRVKASRTEQSARFADPPAPPPQQPLPEKPDNAKAASPGQASVTGLLKRETTMKPSINGSNTSPTGNQSSQILTLLESLKEAQKQIESQGTKVRELEDMLKQERQAREAAEDKVKRLEQPNSPETTLKEEDRASNLENSGSEDKHTTTPINTQENSILQQRIDMMLSEMQMMQKNLENTTKRAEVAENEKSTLAEMIEKYRKEREEAEAAIEVTRDDDADEITRSQPDHHQAPTTPKDNRRVNGHVQAPKLPEHLQQAVASLLQQQQPNGEVPVHYAPYVSMMGVVLIGVGMMAYLNQWQKVDK